MYKMRIGDKTIIRRNGTSMVWEWNRKLKVQAGEEFDPFRAVSVQGCNANPAEVTIVEKEK